MALSRSSTAPKLTRRRFLSAGLAGAAGFALYSSEIARHVIEVTQTEFQIPQLPPAFDGFRVAQMSDIHLEEFTEPFFLRMAVDHINRLQPDAIFLTGDFVTRQLLPRSFSIHSGWKCAGLLDDLKCRQRFAVLGNHDVSAGAHAISEALTTNNTAVLRNSFVPLERGGSRLWLAGLDDCIEGIPDLDRAIPADIRNRPDEPIILLCHEPDFADSVVSHPAGQSVALMLSGHTHGGQIRVPFFPPMFLPGLGKRYVEGPFRLQSLQLYVNRGIGTVGVPFRLNCPPEITLITLRRARLAVMDSPSTDPVPLVHPVTAKL